ncbi:DUF1203 domain-containing protein [Sulfitobacter aestuariivivens]|nr:DUF1203 domain-containing protein [Sulfitobacter aestuariivivens]
MHIQALPTDLVRHWQAGGADAHGQRPEPAISDGNGNPCRHCLNLIPQGAGYLIVAHRPFHSLQPYAECGPLFVCADACTRFEDHGTLPEALKSSPDFLIKGYGRNERIIYGTGTIVTPEEMPARVADIFTDPQIAFIHVRSARNNCYQARIDRTP